MRKTYKIIIEETVSEEFAITAASEAEAVKTAITKYKSGELVLSPGNLIEKKTAVINARNEAENWISF